MQVSALASPTCFYHSEHPHEPEAPLPMVLPQLGLNDFLFKHRAHLEQCGVLPKVCVCAVRSVECAVCSVECAVRSAAQGVCVCSVQCGVCNVECCPRCVCAVCVCGVLPKAISPKAISN